MKNSSFSLYEQKLTNKEINITYKPNTTVLSYSYKIYKDNELYDEVKIKNKSLSKIILDESGTYKIEVTLKHQNGTTSREESGMYVLDLDKPIILLKDDYLTMHTLKNNETFNIQTFEDNIKVTDIQDGNLFSSLKCDTSNIDFQMVGVQKMTCTVSDQAGNISEKEFILQITKDYRNQLNALLGILFFFIFCIILYIIKFQRAVHLTGKILPYSIESLHDKRQSVFEHCANIFYISLAKVNQIFQKSTLIKKCAKKYDKYIPLYSKHYQNGMDFVSTKVIVAILFSLISVISNIIRYRLINPYELFLPCLIGFFVPDIVYIVQYKLYKNRLENDLLQAIIIMNNAFKSGRSITQAIELVTKELDGPIGLEFKKMHMEISFGLTIEEVFRRLADRIGLEEVTYLTASLSILNKTGGNIIKVFSSIEKTLFNKKKLKLELASLTGGSKIIVYVLFAVPFLFILFISLISPSYFEPFYTTEIGFIFVGIMVIIYLLYIWVVNKIMKVRM